MPCTAVRGPSPRFGSSRRCDSRRACASLSGPFVLCRVPVSAARLTLPLCAVEEQVYSPEDGDCLFAPAQTSFARASPPLWPMQSHRGALTPGAPRTAGLGGTESSVAVKEYQAQAGAIAGKASGFAWAVGTRCAGVFARAHLLPPASQPRHASCRCGVRAHERTGAAPRVRESAPPLLVAPCAAAACARPPSSPVIEAGMGEL